MYASRVFQIFLLISVIAHGIILIQNPGFAVFSKDKKEEDVQINYVKKPPEHKPQPRAPAPKRIKKEPFLKLSKKITARKQAPPPYVEKKSLSEPKRRLSTLKANTDRPALIEAQVISLKKKIILPPVMDPDKINNPSYISYYQIVREKIRRAAFRNYNGRETGEVVLSFVVSNDGYLQSVLLIEEGSSKSDYLRELAADSVQAASPFPDFPRALDYPYLLFKLPIAFEVE